MARRVGRMIRQVCLYLTRKCNVTCRYCNVIKYRKPELTTEQLKQALDKICDEIKPELLVFFGGEPFVRKDLQELLDYVKGRVTYTIISNSTLPFKYEGVESLTASIDSDILQVGETKAGDIVKTNCALNRLLEAKYLGVENVTGNMIAHRENYKDIPRLIKTLTNLGIWSIVGVVHCDTSKDDWKFRSTSVDMNLEQEQAEWLSKKLVKMKESGKYLLHNSMEYLEGIAKHGSKLNWHCSKPYYLTVDCDGSLIACNDYWGEEVPKMNIFDFDQEAYDKVWVEDTKNCEGCYYNHQVQVENTGEVIKRW